MGSGSSSTGHEMQMQSNTRRKPIVPRDNAKETDDHCQRSRTFENENGGKFDGDTVGIDSKDMNDMIALSAKMSHYYSGKEVNKMTMNQEKDRDRSRSAKAGKRGEDECVKVKTLSQDDIIEQIAAENFIDPHKVIYELDTIGYYIANGVTKTTNVNENENEANINVVENNLVEIQDDTKPVNDEKKEDDRYEIFKKIYGSSRSKGRKKSSVANNQTLILAKIGAQFKYVAVPAYLPGQKLYKSKSFAGPYIERAKGLYKVKRPKLCKVCGAYQTAVRRVIVQRRKKRFHLEVLDIFYDHPFA